MSSLQATRESATANHRVRPASPRSDGPVIDPTKILGMLARTQRCDPVRVREILAKARLAHGLEPAEVAVLTAVDSPELVDEVFATARAVKETIYGRRVVLFAPLYVSNRCHNECAYCAFRARNRAAERRTLTGDEIAAEARALVGQGHKRVLLVAGEAADRHQLDVVIEAIDTIYGAGSGGDRVRRINVNIAPLDVEGFRRLAGCAIGTYQAFQETYHRPSYRRVHLAGRKADYDWRLGVMDRAMEAGIDDVGIGALFGLYDWRFELLALLEHGSHLEQRFGAGPHTVSVPRIEPAMGSRLASGPPHPVSDRAFLLLIALLRLALPYTGIILSTREGVATRRQALELGVSQISAGSRTRPGGYSTPDASTVQTATGSTASAPRGDTATDEGGQFSLGDHRPLDEVVRDLAQLGYLPSFCTACYRRQRTGADFMALAKPGRIRQHCDPNGLCTFLEYLLDHASERTRTVGLELIERVAQQGSPRERERNRRLLSAVHDGQRDLSV